MDQSTSAIQINILDKIETYSVKRGGNFINLGCYDGLTNDPIADLIINNDLKGWFIDANEEILNQCRENFIGDSYKFECLGIHSKSGIFDFYIAKGNPEMPSWFGQTSTFLKQRVEDLKTELSIGDDMFDVIKLRTERIDEFIAERGITELEIINIDLEGLDEHIIMDFPFHRVKPKYIIIELLYTYKVVNQESVDYIISQGYEYVQTIELFSMVFKLRS
jgi:FkbM family methyltransferase